MSEPVRHVGLHADRMEFPCASTDREKAFAEAWRNENEKGPASAPVLSSLLYGRAPREREISYGFGEVIDGQLTQREAEVAATVIQWLGTNVGWCFLMEVVEATGHQMVSRDSQEQLRKNLEQIPHLHNRIAKLKGDQASLYIARDRISELLVIVDRLMKSIEDKPEEK